MEGRREYEQRLHRVLEHIDRRLDAPLDLTELAGIAHFSPYHFHRLFGAWMGETLGDYLRRRRLEVAALRLVAQPRLAVTNVALAVGFGSLEAFSRAFKLHFGATPSAWRVSMQERKNDQVLRKLDQAPHVPSPEHGLPSTAMEMTMHVTLIDRSPKRIAYLRCTGPYGEAVGDFWMQRVAPWMEANGLLGAPRYGISHDDPSITAPEKCRYDAGVEVAEDFIPGAGVMLTTIPGGRYASTPFKGTSQQISGMWQALLRDWLATSRLQLDARPCFEYYGPASDYDPATGVFECEIVIPVAPL